ncbi:MULTISPECIES: bifunctional 2-polyprenyl-6-hydroxyphenol methylase/3-demethylubiquinol 3-O-methyltransferase UbiG [unclassified Nodularia (in: cyanobacteria)]|uniref:bifunctional 2-polyprenyl-6-hydroxyphenol methylase/3-demethylubiquinol 3-O-methyltransferase UbiG n=1 Tax=unclassified Nodularia (in: cyanobacteria) TaxID=2656917 RepID=UPI001882E57C|nr:MULTISPECIES: bifunctional 2-polyprenyl-6-hydroxyphenol methylase/3-demethylubiquinol 3-O-methyltransferase UbiG [unclassified Nodularia (in: cyanobacteria)]MBE9200575.1 3-demethylubiquinone-9 3-O-methyltransferase [Nodularia sp. LEGE 06071]MCC2692521.1 3-demethylubiquinone-9 3-O-methyltransferase [Nodularia sp. LEGE 04288]
MKKNDLEYYDLKADNWWREGEVLNLSHHLNKFRIDFFSSYISRWQGIKVLDIGCGGGLASETLAKQEASVSGIDLSLPSIKVAQAHSKENNLNIDYHWGIAENLPFANNKFDAVLCCDVLEHVTDWRKVIAEVHRVLKTNGLFFFDTINRTFKSKLIMIWLLEDILKQIPPGLHDWNKFIKPAELTDVMEKNGLSNVVIKGFDLTGGMNFQTFTNILFKGLNYKNQGKKSELFPIKINENTSVWYLGKAVKL